jgi:ribosomal protein S18 acetylase RimI-like enzyme
MHVAAEMRRRGVGRALLLEACARARQVEGLEQLHLTVATTNAAARHLYRSVGFRPYGVEPHALKLGDRYWDEELMVLQW